MTSPHVLQESDLIFPSASSGIKDALGELKRSNLSISNRLRSIKGDADFVQKVSEAYTLPLVANERCGSWYIPPDVKAGSAYFKSTDGHFGQWSFSLRRLNLQVLDVIGEHGGCIIVDSTRRGKSMPDALSKTVPIWICVLNRLLFPGQVNSHALRTPSDVVSKSEYAQIEERIPAFVEGLRSLDLDMSSLRAKLHSKPMQPVWSTPTSQDAEAQTPVAAPLHTVVLCTASGRSSEDVGYASDYVQGAADDSESWAHGLDAAAFWAHHKQLLATPEDALPDLIGDLVAMGCYTSHIREPTPIRPTRNIWVGDNAAAERMYRDFDVVVSCSLTASCVVLEALKERYVHLICATGKNGSRQLRAQLPKLRVISSMFSPESRVLVTCQTGRDFAVGVALALICQLCDGSGAPCPPRTSLAAQATNKTIIKHRLSWIMVSMPDASPSRATLQSVNAYLMG